jgi:3-oxoacyl-[acyl-carrier protein] reductase
MIIITGSSRGIGRALAENFHDSGEVVVGISRTETKSLYQTFSADVSKYEELNNVCKKINDNYEPPSLLINAAGVSHPNLVVLSKPDSIKNMVDTNILGTIYSCQIFTPLLFKNKKSDIINLSSFATSLKLIGESVYSASKSAVETFSNSFAKEVARFNVNVNCIAPGPIDTDMISHLNLEQKNDLVNKQIIRHKFTTNDIHELILTLINDKSRSITGQTIYLGGI